MSPRLGQRHVALLALLAASVAAPSAGAVVTPITPSAQVARATLTSTDLPHGTTVRGPVRAYLTPEGLLASMAGRGWTYRRLLAALRAASFRAGEQTEVAAPNAQDWRSLAVVAGSAAAANRLVDTVRGIYVRAGFLVSADPAPFHGFRATFSRGGRPIEVARYAVSGALVVDVDDFAEAGVHPATVERMSRVLRARAALLT
jgi:hypothetical protein